MNIPDKKDVYGKCSLEIANKRPKNSPRYIRLAATAYKMPKHCPWRTISFEQSKLLENVMIHRFLSTRVHSK